MFDITVDGERFQGSAEQILESMNRTAIIPCDNYQQYMARWNRHCDNLGLPTLDNTTARSFVRDMIRLGYATIGE